MGRSTPPDSKPRRAAARDGAPAGSDEAPALADATDDAPLLSDDVESASFARLGLPDAMLATLAELGFAAPTPIQAATIPLLLAGRDVLGQAQTGTGKTAAFALPILARVSATAKEPRALVLTPTRELAMQVADSFRDLGAALKPKHRIACLYGGAAYGPQLSTLRAGASIVIGTPGRIIDHLERGALDLAQLEVFVLDEADEMLRMGFFEDVTRIIGQTPSTRQVTLFSATMPAPIRAVAREHMRDAAEVRVAAAQLAAESVRHRYLPVDPDEKLPALALLCEVAVTDAALVFVRTKAATVEIADALFARGFRAAALSGDLSQAHRERTVEQLRNGQIDVVVATDVAARGLDVERIAHVINYDTPTDPETYVHRVGRTGRAGRTGEAILFLEARQRRLIPLIERATGATLERMRPPSVEELNARRIAAFEARITGALERAADSEFRPLLEALCKREKIDPVLAAAALAAALHGDRPFLAKVAPVQDRTAPPAPRATAPKPHGVAPRTRTGTDEPVAASDVEARPRPKGITRPARVPVKNVRPPRPPRRGMEWFRVEVGERDGAHPGAILAHVAREAGLDGRRVGTIDVGPTWTFVELPGGMPERVFRDLDRTRFAGRPLSLSRVDS